MNVEEKVKNLTDAQREKLVKAVLSVHRQPSFVNGMLLGFMLHACLSVLLARDLLEYFHTESVNVALALLASYVIGLSLLMWAYTRGFTLAKRSRAASMKTIKDIVEND